MTGERYDDEFVERLREAARDYNQPPEVPREAMWSRIQARRSEERAAGGSRVRGRRLWRPRRLWWPAVAAAVLVLGVAIGRMTTEHATPERVAGTEIPAGTEGVTLDQKDATTPTSDATGRQQSNRREIYRLAAAPVLGEAEVLLTQFRTGDATNGFSREFSDRATKLLLDTRLLLDSPAAEDPQMSRLLVDLELILAKIVRLARESENGKEGIDENIEDRSVLPRLRTTFKSGDLAAIM